MCFAVGKMEVPLRSFESALRHHSFCRIVAGSSRHWIVILFSIEFDCYRWAIRVGFGAAPGQSEGRIATDPQDECCAGTQASNLNAYAERFVRTIKETM